MPFLYLFIFLSCATLTKAQQPTAPSKKFDDLKAGMSEFQIKQLIGEPLKFESFTTVKYNSFDTSIYWRYPNEIVVVVTNHQYDRIEKNRDALLKYIQQKSGKNEVDGLTVISHGKK